VGGKRILCLKIFPFSFCNEFNYLVLSWCREGRERGGTKGWVYYGGEGRNILSLMKRKWIFLVGGLLLGFEEGNGSDAISAPEISMCMKCCIVAFTRLLNGFVFRS